MILLIWIINHSKILFWVIFIAAWVTTLLTDLEGDNVVYCILLTIVLLLVRTLGDYFFLLGLSLIFFIPLIIHNIFLINDGDTSFHQKVPYTTGNPRRKNKSIRKEKEPELKPLSIMNEPSQPVQDKKSESFIISSSIKINIKEEGEN